MCLFVAMYFHAFFSGVGRCFGFGGGGGGADLQALTCLSTGVLLYMFHMCRYTGNPSKVTVKPVSLSNACNKFI